VSSPWGPFVGPAHVRDAVEATLNLWAATYVGEAVRQTVGRNLNPPLTSFEDWVNEPGITGLNPTMAPRYVVAVPGTVGDPQRHGDGTYRAIWQVLVNVWMWGPDYQTTEDYLGYYLVALRMALCQHPSLGGFAESTHWAGERYAQAAPPTAFHTWGHGVLTVLVTVDGVLNAYAGPSTVPANPATPPVPPPAVTSEHVTVAALPLS